MTLEYLIGKMLGTIALLYLIFKSIEYLYKFNKIKEVDDVRNK
jgi:hypothetical protein